MCCTGQGASIGDAHRDRIRASLPGMRIDDSKAIRALLVPLRRICAGLPAAEEYVMVHHPAFRVGKKPFAIAGMEEATKGATVSINLGRDAQDGLLADTRFSRTPYIGQHGWVTVPAALLQAGELDALVIESWRRVASKKQLALRDGGAREASPAGSKPKPTKRR